MTEEGKEKKVNIDFEPFRPINTSLYLCDNKFHTEVRQTVSVLALDLLRTFLKAFLLGRLSECFISGTRYHSA